ncbi:MAG TPA: response regulator transcription factor [Candidatus Avanaerovorax faecigallinarum]|nr:response regulator transcription factor [Candidatus Avanaerovorax faecigallinarum]
MNHILIIDDDVNINKMLDAVLTKADYRVSHAYSGTEALLFLSGERPDLILLDLMLPGLSGEEVLPEIKGVPVIVMSAKVDTKDKVSMLLGGAADYITKPFDIEELLARIAVQLRKSGAAEEDDTLTFDDITLLPQTWQAEVAGQDVRLTKTEFAILKLLMENPRQVVTKSILLDRISEDTPDCVESSLKVHVSNLRKKLRDASGRDYIETVWGIGFKMKSE